jgi:hypothetical protein
MSYEFTFNASAIGVGGLLTDGDTTTAIPSLASVALAPTGGEGFSEETNYNQCGVSFTKAESRVVGQKIAADTYATYVDVLISNFAVRGRLKVALMQASMTSIRNINEDDSRFEFRAAYRGVTVDEKEIVPELDLDLVGCSTYDEFRRHLACAPNDFAQRFGYPGEPALVSVLNSARQPAIWGTLVKPMDAQNVQTITEDTGVLITGHRILVRDFGSVNLAEFLFKPGRRRVSLVRLDFDERSVPSQAVDATPVAPGFARALADFGGGGGGSLTGGSVEGNGSTIPPRA